MSDKISPEAAEALQKEFYQEQYTYQYIYNAINKHTEQPVPQYHEGDYIIDGSGRLCRLGAHNHVDDPRGKYFDNTQDMRTKAYLEKPVCDIVRLAEDKDWITVDKDGIRWKAYCDEDGWLSLFADGNNISFGISRGINSLHNEAVKSICKDKNIPIRPAKEK